ncbi:hypothetical protein BHM03_00041090 [Ensete ventricosum]|nr:hypothetical protein BHM03_00041090 [Ensete ventricosum]
MSKCDEFGTSVKKKPAERHPAAKEPAERHPFWKEPEAAGKKPAGEFPAGTEEWLRKHSAHLLFARIHGEESLPPPSFALEIGEASLPFLREAESHLPQRRSQSRAKGNARRKKLEVAVESPKEKSSSATRLLFDKEKKLPSPSADRNRERKR